MLVSVLSMVFQPLEIETQNLEAPVTANFFLLPFINDSFSTNNTCIMGR